MDRVICYQKVLRIPELLENILRNLTGLQLLPLRLVCHQWKEVIEHICRTQRHRLWLGDPLERDTSLQLKVFSDGYDIDHFMVLRLHHRPVHQLVLNLVKHFPLVDQLVLRLDDGLDPHLADVLLAVCWPGVRALSLALHTKLTKPSSDTALVDRFLVRINQLPQLTRLELGKPFQHMPTVNTMTRLEHLSMRWVRHEAFVQSVSRLQHPTPRLTSLQFAGLSLHPAQLDTLVQYIQSSLANLTQLGLGYLSYWDDSLAYLLKRCSALKELTLELFYPKCCSTFLPPISSLTHLTTLSLYLVVMDLDRLENALLGHTLRPMPSVRVLSLRMYTFPGVNNDAQFVDKLDAPRFCRTLATIFPNLQKFIHQPLLRSEFVNHWGTVTGQLVHSLIHSNIQQHLQHFKRLTTFQEFILRWPLIATDLI